MKTSLLLTFVFPVKRLWAGERVFARVLLSGHACALLQEVPPFRNTGETGLGLERGCVDEALALL